MTAPTDSRDPRDPVIALLRDLVAIDSVNPTLVPGGAGEGEIAARVAEEMRSFGMAVETPEAAPGRPNAVGVLEGRRPGPALMFCGHIDTVGVEGMTAPFDPVERDGRLYGRGSVDMKGGVAAMLGAARKVAERGLPAGRLIVAAVADEEYTSLGAEALVKEMKTPEITAAVVTEPTDLAVVVGHKGFSWVEVEAGGRAAHGSRPREGRDAILRMGRVLARLEALDRALQAGAQHPLLGPGSLHASTIEGGREWSTYPDRCRLVLERRTLPGEAETAALAEVEEILVALRAEDPEFEASARPLFDRLAYETPADNALPAALEAALAGLGLPARREGVSFWTDAAVLGHAGIPTVVFGPGGEGAHAIEEHVRVGEVIACRDALAELAWSFCAGDAGGRP
jgi:acetylornithine deacetylase/succinyl-diaminopimelate desuccinylase family protein